MLCTLPRVPPQYIVCGALTPWWHPAQGGRGWARAEEVLVRCVNIVNSHTATPVSTSSIPAHCHCIHTYHLILPCPVSQQSAIETMHLLSIFHSFLFLPLTERFMGRFYPNPGVLKISVCLWRPKYEVGDDRHVFSKHAAANTDNPLC